MYAFSQSNTLPKKVIVGSRDYNVLGFYKYLSGKTWTEDRTKVVLERPDYQLVTNWPMNVYKSLTRYEEQY